MATNSTWTVVFDDKLIIKNTGAEAGTGYIINDDVFWSKSDFSNFWAIQYGNSVTSDEVEYRDTTPNSSWADTGLPFQQFIDKWDQAHLLKLQSDWDNSDIPDPETEAEKIARLGPRPISYSS